MKKIITLTYLNSTPKSETFEWFVRDIVELLPEPVRSREAKEEYPPVQRSLQCIAGEKMTEEAISLICWRMAGNVHRLAANIPVFPWTKQPFNEWVPAQVIQATRRRSLKGKPGHLFTFRILAGLSAGMKTTQLWTDAQCGMYSKEFGFNRYRPSDKSDKLPSKLYQHPTEFISLRMSILVEPKLCTQSEPGFEKTRLTVADLAWNKDILALRDRLDPAKRAHCLMNMATQCFQCPYGTDKCPAGTHANTYVFQYCESCEDETAPFDLGLDTELCVRCRERKVMSRKA